MEQLTGFLRHHRKREHVLWAMFQRKGSLPVMATAAELQGLVSHPSLPLPLRGLKGIDREELESLLAKLELTE
jgi:4-hydroxy-tetrahydrodipicolinate synthase